MSKLHVGRAKADLVGRCILVIADEFADARDTQQALQHAGAKVIGPFNDATSALRYIAQGRPNCAILSTGLRGGALLSVASALFDKQVPTILVSGPEASALPIELEDIPRVRKPIDTYSLLRLAARLSVAGAQNQTE